MWSGRLQFGEFWAAYLGRTDQNSPHAHVALQLAIGIGGDVEVELEGGALRARGVLIRTLAVHRVAPDLPRVAFLYVEPQAPLGQALLQVCGDAAGVALPDTLTRLAADSPDRAVDQFEQALGVAGRPALDARLERALALLGASVGAPGGVARAAAEVRLSESRLRRLARDALRAPLARWTLWRKLERSVRALAGGATLVDAAAVGCFSDQAHLARTMRRMFGITPTELARAVRSRRDPEDLSG